MRAAYFLLAVLALCSRGTNAFVPNVILDVLAATLEFTTFDSMNHRDITRDAVLMAVREILHDNPNPDPAAGDSSARLDALPTSSLGEASLLEAYFGRRNRDRRQLFEDAIVEMQDANENVDFAEETLGEAHFDDELFVESQNRLVALRYAIVGEIRHGHYAAARTQTGRLFHTLQDFYSHSNWIENGNTAPSDSLATPGRRLENVATPETQTCIACPVDYRISYWFGILLDTKFEERASTVYKCRDNVHPDLISKGTITTGFYAGDLYEDGRRIVKPPNKCSHGGILDASSDQPVVGGINKDSLSFYFAAHPHLHLKAAGVAAQATFLFFQSIRQEVADDMRFATYFNIELPGSKIEADVTSIAFVIDTTDSMADVLPAIQLALPHLRAELMAYVKDLGEGAMVKLILVPYNDPDPGVVIETTNIDEFIGAIASLRLSYGRGDCIEPAFGAIIRALEHSLPRSAIYVFTDAPAGDEARLVEVQALISRKDVEVNFVLTPGCTSVKHMSRKARYTGRALYRYVAAFSGGQVLEVDASEVTAVTRLVSTSARRTHTTILHETGSGGFSDSFNFPVDETVEEVVVIVSGDSPVVHVITPLGDDVSEHSSFSLDLQSANLYIATINTMSVAHFGAWRLKCDIGESFDVRVIGLADVSARYRLYGPKSSAQFGHSYIRGKPIAGAKLTFIVQLQGDRSEGQFTSVTINSIDTDESESFGLELTGKGDYTGRDKLNTGTYQVSIHGRDTSGNALTRVSSRGLQATDIYLTLAAGQLDFIRVRKGQERTITLVLENVGATTSLELRLKGDKDFAQYSLSIAPSSVTVYSGAEVQVLIKVRAPEVVTENDIATMLTVLAHSKENVLRSDFFTVNIFTIGVDSTPEEPPTVTSKDSFTNAAAAPRPHLPVVGLAVALMLLSVIAVILV